jgi:hypothetical protein
MPELNLKRPIHSQLNWANCAILTRNCAGLRNVSSSRVLHRELRRLLRESPSFISLPADTKTASSQGTQPSKMNKREKDPHHIFLFKYHSLLHILRFLFLFSYNIMTDVASKQQTTALFLSTTVTRTRRYKKLANMMGKPVLCQRTFSSVFRAVFTQLNCTV